jgi:4-diphosphocytidyl-2-C-methyl-D-erythritol kinase
MTRGQAYAKINLGLVVGPLRADGKHEIATVLERVDLHDVVDIERVDAAGVVVEGFAGDTLVRRALELLEASFSLPGGWRARLEKRIPVAAGLGGGSSDAATALRIANELADAPLAPEELRALAATLGSDVPFFLTGGAKLATGDGTELEPLALPQAYWAVLALPQGARKASTGAVYAQVDADSTVDFEKRRQSLLELLRELEHPLQLAELPRNDLAFDGGSSALGAELAALGAFRTDVSGAGPTVYGLFELERDARHASENLRRAARTWLVRPVTGM